jgi:hypothetical protein
LTDVEDTSDVRDELWRRLVYISAELSVHLGLINSVMGNYPQYVQQGFIERLELLIAEISTRFSDSVRHTTMTKEVCQWHPERGAKQSVTFRNGLSLLTCDECFAAMNGPNPTFSVVALGSPGNSPTDQTSTNESNVDTRGAWDT